MPRKDPNCPSCGGRSFDASGGSDAYFECPLCEEINPAYVKNYRERWPAHYQAWQQSVKDRGMVESGELRCLCPACDHPIAWQSDRCANCGQDALA